jgi:hypothetical protein
MIFLLIRTTWMIKSRRITVTGHVARMGLKEGAYRILVWELEGKRSLFSQLKGDVCPFYRVTE